MNRGSELLIWFCGSANTCTANQPFGRADAYADFARGLRGSSHAFKRRAAFKARPRSIFREPSYPRMVRRGSSDLALVNTAGQKKQRAIK
jgi:hypothetical protein